MISVVSIAGIALLATACSGAANSPQPVKVQDDVTVQVDNTMHFAVESLSVEAGQPVTVTLQNVGESTHDFTLTNGVATPVKIEATAGQSSRGTFVINTPGTYEFVCSQPAHALLGMRGSIVVHS